MSDPNTTSGRLAWAYKPASGYVYGSTMYWVPGVCHNISNEADARLIAAAPDLLDALKGLLDFIKINKLPMDRDALHIARAAVAKVEKAA